MTKEDLLDRINKKNIQIAKAEKRLQKLENQKSVEYFVKDTAPYYDREPKNIKTMEDLIAARMKRFPDEPYDKAKAFMERNYQEHVDYIDRDIRGTNRDIEEMKDTILKYQNMLNIQDEKSKISVIKIFKDFVENYKEKILEYVERIKTIYNEKSRESAELWNSGGMRDPEKKARIEQLRKEMNDLYTGWFRIYKDKNKDSFLKYVDEYFNKLYNELVLKVTDIVGEISSVEHLRIGSDGSLNGVVIGSKADAKIETIVAGGYNIQCRHYRVLVHKLKGSEKETVKHKYSTTDTFVKQVSKVGNNLDLEHITPINDIKVE